MEFDRLTRSRSALVALVCLLAGPLAAGVVYEIEVTDHGKSPATSQAMQATVEGRNLMMEIAGGGSGGSDEMIFHGERREMMIIDHDDKSYMVMDQETIAKLSTQVNAAMAQMQEALKNVPEAQRAMVEKMMKERMPQQASKKEPAELRKTKERAEQNGYPCVKYELVMDGKKTAELWVTDWDNVEGGDDVVSAFDDMAAFFRELMDAMPTIGDQGAMAGEVFGHMSEMNGFPVVTKNFEHDGSLETESNLRSAKRQSIDPDAFEPPSGYKRRNMMPGGR